MKNSSYFRLYFYIERPHHRGCSLHTDWLLTTGFVSSITSHMSNLDQAAEWTERTMIRPDRPEKPSHDGAVWTSGHIWTSHSVRFIFLFLSFFFNFWVFRLCRSRVEAWSLQNFYFVKQVVRTVFCFFNSGLFLFLSFLIVKNLQQIKILWRNI